MTRELILKRYERGMKPAEIAAVDNLTLAHVEEVISSSGVQPVQRKQGKDSQAGTITDEELLRRIKDGNTRYAIERDLNMTPGTLISRFKRASKQIDESKLRAEEERKNQAIANWAREGKTLSEIRQLAKTNYRTVKQILESHGLYQEVVNNSQPEPAGKEPSQKTLEIEQRREQLITYAKEGLTRQQIATKLKISASYAGALARELGLKLSKPKVASKSKKKVIENKQASEDANVDQPTLAAQETAVTLEDDGFVGDYTIEALMKEEEQMTEAIAEVKQETEERNEPNDKWVHFIVSQIAAAKVKTKFDVVDRGGKLVKQTEVRFVIEEVL